MEPTVGHAIIADRPAWTRGPARLNADWVILDTTKAENYSTAGLDLLFELASIGGPADIVPFVRRFGLLWHSANYETDCREKVADWQREASHLRYQLTLWRLLQRSIAGDVNANQVLWDYQSHFQIRYTQDVYPRAPLSDDELHVTVSQLLAWHVDKGLEDMRIHIAAGAIVNVGGHLGEPGRFLFIPGPPNLLGFAYHQLALLLVDRMPLDTCRECGRFYHVTDRRQQYCSPTCAGRARHRRWTARKSEETQNG
jgi:hypothetical protein